jgi:arylsulfatase
MKFYDVWGSDLTYPHMAVAWTWAFDTPFSWTKQIASHFGGVRQGMAISWPKVITDKGAIRNQFHHIIDIVPTILEATGIKAPDVVDGITQKPIEGVSMVYTFDARNANAPSRHHTQYFEMMGDHAIYHDGWIASTKVFRPPWVTAGAVSQDPAGFPYELYDLTKDWTQYDNVAAKYPDKLKELERLFWVEANKYQVLPLDASCITRAVAHVLASLSAVLSSPGPDQSPAHRMVMRRASSTRRFTSRPGQTRVPVQPCRYEVDSLGGTGRTNAGPARSSSTLNTTASVWELSPSTA